MFFSTGIYKFDQRKFVPLKNRKEADIAVPESFLMIDIKICCC